MVESLKDHPKNKSTAIHPIEESKQTHHHYFWITKSKHVIHQVSSDQNPYDIPWNLGWLIGIHIFIGLWNNPYKTGSYYSPPAYTAHNQHHPNWSLVRTQVLAPTQTPTCRRRSKASFTSRFWGEKIQEFYVPRLEGIFRWAKSLSIRVSRLFLCFCFFWSEGGVLYTSCLEYQMLQL